MARFTPDGVLTHPYITDNFVLSAQNAIDKGVQLSNSPIDPNKVEFSPNAGPEQRAGTDFVVSGSFLSWNALALELLLDVGSSFSIRYITN